MYNINMNINTNINILYKYYYKCYERLSKLWTIISWHVVPVRWFDDSSDNVKTVYEWMANKIYNNEKFFLITYHLIELLLNNYN